MIKIHYIPRATYKLPAQLEIPYFLYGTDNHKETAHITVHATICSKKLEDMDIKENYEEEILFVELNGNILKVYEDDSSTGE